MHAATSLLAALVERGRLPAAAAAAAAAAGGGPQWVVGVSAKGQQAVELLLLHCAAAAHKMEASLFLRFAVSRKGLRLRV